RLCHCICRGDSYSVGARSGDFLRLLPDAPSGFHWERVYSGFERRTAPHIFPSFALGAIHPDGARLALVSTVLLHELGALGLATSRAGAHGCICADDALLVVDGRSGLTSRDSAGRSLYFWHAGGNEIYDPPSSDSLRCSQRTLAVDFVSEDPIRDRNLFLEQSGLVCVVYVRTKTLPAVPKPRTQRLRARHILRTLKRKC